jgi:hypothetical protein
VLEVEVHTVNPVETLHLVEQPVVVEAVELQVQEVLKQQVVQPLQVRLTMDKLEVSYKVEAQTLEEVEVVSTVVDRVVETLGLDSVVEVEEGLPIQVF